MGKSAKLQAKQRQTLQQKKAQKPIHPNSRRAAQINRQQNRLDSAELRNARTQFAADRRVQRLVWFREHLVHIMDGSFDSVSGAPVAASNTKNAFTVAEICSAIEAHVNRHDRTISALQDELLECRSKRATALVKMHQLREEQQKDSVIGSSAHGDIDDTGAAATSDASAMVDDDVLSSVARATEATRSQLAGGVVKAKSQKKPIVSSRRVKIGSDRRAADIMSQIQELQHLQREEREAFLSGSFEAPDLTMKRVCVALRQWDGQNPNTDFARWRYFRPSTTAIPDAVAVPVLGTVTVEPQDVILGDAANPYGLLEAQDLDPIL